MIAGRWFVGPHALQRYVEITRRVTEARARAILAEETERARILAEVIDDTEHAHHVRPERDGAALWRGPKPHRLRYIVGLGEGAHPAVITVLGEHDGVRRPSGPARLVT